MGRRGTRLQSITPLTAKRPVQQLVRCFRVRIALRAPHKCLGLRASRKWAKKNGHTAHVSRVRHLNDKKKADHWRKV